MDYILHGFPGTEAYGQTMGQAGCGCSTGPGPAPWPFPPSPMMPGPSMQGCGCGDSPGSQPGPTGPVQEGSLSGPSGHTGCSGSSSHQTGKGSSGHAHPGTSHSASMHHPPLHEAYHYGYYPHGVPPQPEDPASEGYSILGLHLSDGNFWKGALVGAVLTLLITNESVQRAIMSGVARAYSAAQDGVGELKEMFEDAQAELKKPNE